MTFGNKKVFGLILSHDCEQLIDATIKRIPNNLFYEVIVSDDGSTDDSVSKYKELGYKVFETSNSPVRWVKCNPRHTSPIMHL